MRSRGFEPKGGSIIADDKWQQASAPGDTARWFSGAYTAKQVNAEFAIGCYFSRKDPDTKYKWHSKAKTKLSPEEKKEIDRTIAADKKRKEKEEKRRHDRVSERLTRVYDRLPILTNHPYLTRKGVKAYDLRHRIKGNEIVLAIRDSSGRITTIQRIDEAGNKYLWRGGKKQGSYISVGSAEISPSVVCIAEGYATAASIREATEFAVFAAIDSGNLLPVASALRRKYLDAKFIICHDNDEYTRKANGDKWNVGREKADAAAVKVGGAFVIGPPIIGDKNTDFNDLHKERGLSEVSRIINEVVQKISAQSPAPESGGRGESVHAPNQPPAAVPDYAEGMALAAEAEAIGGMKGDFGMNFRVLGHNEGTYYYYSFAGKQIVELTAPAHGNIFNLYKLDNLDSWQAKFGAAEKNASEKKMAMYAGNALMILANNRGIFKAKHKIRAAGAWVDDGRKVLHCGDVIYVDGIKMPFDKIESEFTYVAADKITKPSDSPLSNSEAYALRQICEAVTWENKMSGSLLAGFLVIAQVCGVFGFRPHVWITGEAESGKSTVIDKIIKPVIGSVAVHLDGRSTEPKIREEVGYGALPIIFDEAEKSPNIEAVIELARASTDGRSVGKFGQKVFKGMSCFCFSAINPPVNKTADESRITFMTIKKNTRNTAIEEYDALLQMIDRVITKDISARLLSRTMKNLDTLLENVKTFERAARRIVRSARSSQMLGVLLAGLYLLSKTDLITIEAATEWLSKYDWTNHTIAEEESDPIRLLQYLSSSLLRYEAPGLTARNMSIGDLIVMASKHDIHSDKILRNNGIAYKDGRVHIAGRCHQLEKILKETDWSYKWAGMLANLEGAEKFQKPFYFGVAFKTSGVSLPISIFTMKEPKIETQQEFTDEMEIPF